MSYVLDLILFGIWHQQQGNMLATWKVCPQAQPEACLVTQVVLCCGHQHMCICHLATWTSLASYLNVHSLKTAASKQPQSSSLASCYDVQPTLLLSRQIVPVWCLISGYEKFGNTTYYYSDHHEDALQLIMSLVGARQSLVFKE